MYQVSGFFEKVNGSPQIYLISPQLQPQIQDMKGQAADAHGLLSQLALKSLKQWKFVVLVLKCHVLPSKFSLWQISSSKPSSVVHDAFKFFSLKI